MFAAGAVRSFWCVSGSSSVFCNEWLFMCVVLCVCCISVISGCRSHCNGCMNIAWGLCWGESRGRKPCVFPCKMAAAGDERYLVCAGGAAWVVSSLNRFLVCVLQQVVVHVCVVLSFRFVNLWLQITV